MTRAAVRASNASGRAARRGHALYGRPALGLALAVSLLAGCADHGTAIVSRPNVVLIVVDTLRWDHVGVYGATRDTTPAIDELAAEAVRFDRAYAPTGWTNPSVASIITGTFPSHHSATSFDRRLPDAAETLAEILAAAGYDTAAAVANRHIGPQHNFDQGYAVYLMDEARGHDHVSTPGITRQALEQLERLADQPRPFLLYVHYFDPHFNYVRHPTIGWADPPAGRLDGTERIGRLRDMLDDMTDEEVALLLDLYAEEVRFTDDGIGRVIERIEQLGLDDDTWIVVTSDHGEEFLSHGWLGHTRTLYDELVRVPLVIRPPGGAPTPIVVTRPVSLVSVTPTLVDVVGLDPADRKFQAPSLAPLWTGVQPIDEASIFCEVDFVPVRPSRQIVETRKKALVHEDYKLVRDELSGKQELYDLVRDPHEATDLAARDPERVARLSFELEQAAERARVGALEVESRAVDAEELERLKSLGYVGGP